MTDRKTDDRQETLFRLITSGDQPIRMQNAIARDAAAIRLHGEYAKLNFPDLEGV